MKKISPNQRSIIFTWSLYGLLIFMGFAVADLGIIFVRDYFIPDQAPPKRAAKPPASHFVDRSQYSGITSRNLFSSSGVIPDPLALQENKEKKEDVPVPSNLPLTLIGTLVHTNPAKSVAAIEVKSKNMTGSYMAGAEIENLAKIEKIERNIVYFRNLNNGALEYIEANKANGKVNFDVSKAAEPIKAGGKEVQSLGNNTFRIKKTDLNKYLGNLSSLLLEARALPSRDANGDIEGYRLVDFKPDSIFAQLGIPRGALIKEVNGEPVTSIQAAMGLFNKLKSEPKVQIKINTNGSDSNFNYEIQ